MGDDGRGTSLAEVRAMVRTAELERDRLLRGGHPRGDPANPSCPLGCLDLWLTALHAHRDDLLRRDGEGGRSVLAARPR